MFYDGELVNKTTAKILFFNFLLEELKKKKNSLYEFVSNESYGAFKVVLFYRRHHNFGVHRQR